MEDVREVQAFECTQCFCKYPYTECDCCDKELEPCTLFFCPRCGNSFGSRHLAVNCCDAFHVKRKLKWAKSFRDRQRDDDERVRALNRYISYLTHKLELLEDEKCQKC